MLFVLGIGSAVALCSAITTAIWDEFPSVQFWKVAGCTTLIGFLMGLVYVTPGGQWILTLVDHFGGTFLIFALAIAEIMVIFWIYGLQNFCDDVEFMSKKKISMYWRINWAVLTPG
jgi:solute carrier family 6 (neurotransmitter transporter, glycine) member 5/9